MIGQNFFSRKIILTERNTIYISAKRKFFVESKIEQEIVVPLKNPI